MSWLDGKRGYDVAEKIEKQKEEQKASYVPRFWLKEGTTTQVIFLDDNPPVFPEHQLKINGDWKNWFTCSTVIGENCSHCQADDKPAVTGFYTIVDCTRWEDKKKNVHVNEKKILAAKMTTLKKLKRASQKAKARGLANGLVGCKFEVCRTSQEAPNTGDDWEFIEQVPEEVLRSIVAKGDIEPYDYDKLLKPKSLETMAEAIAKNEKDRVPIGKEEAEAVFKDNDIEF